MRFRLLSAAGGPVLNTIGFLHATNLLACYRGSTDRLDLAPGVPTEVEIVFDEADDTCGMPATIATMKVVLNAPADRGPQDGSGTSSGLIAGAADHLGESVSRSYRGPERRGPGVVVGPGGQRAGASEESARSRLRRSSAVPSHGATG
jgi:hypothetical protein